MTSHCLNSRSALSRAFARLARGGIVALADDQSRRGVLFAAAELAEAEIVAVMAREARGPVGIAMSPARRRGFGIPDMPGCRRPMTVEAATGVGTGISAVDRARTLRAAAQWPPHPEALRHPGHVPVEEIDAGAILTSRDVSAAALAAVHLSGRGCAIVCPVLSLEGEIASATQVRRLAGRLGISCLCVDELRLYVDLDEQVRRAA